MTPWLPSAHQNQSRASNAIILPNHLAISSPHTAIRHGLRLDSGWCSMDARPAPQPDQHFWSIIVWRDRISAVCFCQTVGLRPVDRLFYCARTSHCRNLHNQSWHHQPKLVSIRTHVRWGSSLLEALANQFDPHNSFRHSPLWGFRLTLEHITIFS